jgi:hypothetical protein
MPIHFDPEILEENNQTRLERVFQYYDHLRIDGEFNRVDFHNRIAKASFQENIEIYSGNIRISTISESNQFKLFLFVKYVLENNIPTENEVSQLFKITNVSAQTLIRNMQSRFRYELQSALNYSMSNVLESIIQDNIFGQGKESYYEMYVRSKSLIRTMNQIIQYANEPHPPIALCRGYSNKYKITEITKTFLEQYVLENINE